MQIQYGNFNKKEIEAEIRNFYNDAAYFQDIKNEAVALIGQTLDSDKIAMKFSIDSLDKLQIRLLGKIDNPNLQIVLKGLNEEIEEIKTRIKSEDNFKALNSGTQEVCKIFTLRVNYIWEREESNLKKKLEKYGIEFYKIDQNQYSQISEIDLTVQQRSNNINRKEIESDLNSFRADFEKAANLYFDSYKEVIGVIHNKILNKDIKLITLKNIDDAKLYMSQGIEQHGFKSLGQLGRSFISCAQNYIDGKISKKEITQIMESSTKTSRSDVFNTLNSFKANAEKYGVKIEGFEQFEETLRTTQKVCNELADTINNKGESRKDTLKRAQKNLSNARQSIKETQGKITDPILREILERQDYDLQSKQKSIEKELSKKTTMGEIFETGIVTQKVFNKAVESIKNKSESKKDHLTHAQDNLNNARKSIKESKDKITNPFLKVLLDIQDDFLKYKQKSIEKDLSKETIKEQELEKGKSKHTNNSKQEQTTISNIIPDSTPNVQTSSIIKR
jgi:hypothetical protein